MCLRYLRSVSGNRDFLQWGTALTHTSLVGCYPYQFPADFILHSKNQGFWGIFLKFPPDSSRFFGHLKITPFSSISRFSRPHGNSVYSGCGLFWTFFSNFALISPIIIRLRSSDVLPGAPWRRYQIMFDRTKFPPPWKALRGVGDFWLGGSGFLTVLLTSHTFFKWLWRLG